MKNKTTNLIIGIVASFIVANEAMVVMAESVDTYSLGIKLINIS